jgi:hypothetical protein
MGVAMPNRTRSGNVTSEAREKHGSGKKGKFPIFDQKSCVNAVGLRHNAKGEPSASAVLAKAARWASANNNDT